MYVRTTANVSVSWADSIIFLRTCRLLKCWIRKTGKLVFSLKWVLFCPTEILFCNTYMYVLVHVCVFKCYGTFKTLHTCTMSCTCTYVRAFSMSMFRRLQIGLFILKCIAHLWPHNYMYIRVIIVVVTYFPTNLHVSPQYWNITFSTSDPAFVQERVWFDRLVLCKMLLMPVLKIPL